MKKCFSPQFSVYITTPVHNFDGNIVDVNDTTCIKLGFSKEEFVSMGVEDVDTVISAMKLGAYDYVVKPLYMDGLEVNNAACSNLTRINRID